MSSRISVIVAVYDGERYLGEALDSILTQTRQPDEIVVVDDGSTDRSGEVARRFSSVRCIRQQHAGQARALNSGVALTNGEFLAFLDADDLWLSNKLELQLAALSHRPELDVVFGHAQQFAEPGVLVAQNAREQLLPSRLPSAMFLRRSAWKQVGAFSEQWAVGSVIEWCARLDDLRLPWAMLDAVVYRRRIHDKNLSRSRRDAATEYASMLRCVLGRRRDNKSEASSGAGSQGSLTSLDER